MRPSLEALDVLPAREANPGGGKIRQAPRGQVVIEIGINKMVGADRAAEGGHRIRETGRRGVLQRDGSGRRAGIRGR